MTEERIVRVIRDTQKGRRDPGRPKKHFKKQAISLDEEDWDQSELKIKLINL
jgi:hypothetical protein